MNKIRFPHQVHVMRSEAVGGGLFPKPLFCRAFPAWALCPLDWLSREFLLPVLHRIIPVWASVLNTADHKIPFRFCCINIGSQIV